MDLTLIHAACAVVAFVTLAMALVSTLFAGLLMLGIRLHRNDRYRRWGVRPDDGRDEEVKLLHVASLRPEYRQEIEDFLHDAADAAATVALLMARARLCLWLCIVCFAAASAVAVSALL